MTTVNEKTTATLEFAFFDENSDAVTPDAATFKIYDKFSGTELRTGTVTGLDDTVDFDIIVGDNTLTDQTNRYELRILEVEFTYGTKTGRGEYEWQVENLSYLT